MAKQLSFLQKLFQKSEPAQKSIAQLIELELKAVLQIEQKYGNTMGTGETVAYCTQRFGVPSNEATWVNSGRVHSGVVSKYQVRDYVSWYLKRNREKFINKYPFQYISITGKVHEEGYKKTL